MNRREEQVIEELAGKVAPGDVDKVSRQFSERLARLGDDGHLPADVIDKLQTMWRMLQAPDAIVPWPAKAKIMAALTYFVSPVDLIPDFLGKFGHLDDAQIVRLAWRSIADADAAYRASQ